MINRIVGLLFAPALFPSACFGAPLDDYLACDRDDLALEYGVLSEKGLRTSEINLGEMNSGWHVILPRKRFVYGYPVRKFSVYIGEHVNYTSILLDGTAKSVTDNIARQRGKNAIEHEPSEEVSFVRDKLMAGEPYYSIDDSEIEIYPASKTTALLVCNSDIGNGLSSK